MDRQQTLEFISLLEGMPELWQKEHRDFMNRDVRQRSIRELSHLIGWSEETCKKRLKNLKDKMRDLSHKLPRTPEDRPDFESGAQSVRWTFFQPLLFMKEEFVGRETSSDGAAQAGHERSSTRSGHSREDFVISYVESASDEDAEEQQQATENGEDEDDDEMAALYSPAPSPAPAKVPRLASGIKQDYNAGAAPPARPLHRGGKRNSAGRRSPLDRGVDGVGGDNSSSSGSKEPPDEWQSFCSSIAHDLRKIKDPFLVMQVKADINKAVSETVVRQLHQNMQSRQPLQQQQ